MTPFEKYLEESHTDIKSMKDNIAAIIKKLNDKPDHKIEKNLHPTSVQIKYISSKRSENIQHEVITITY